MFDEDRNNTTISLTHGVSVRAREQNAELQHELWETGSSPGVSAPHTHTRTCTHARATSPSTFLTYSATATSPTPHARHAHAFSARHSPGSGETTGEEMLVEMQRAAQAQRTQPPACIPAATSRVAAAAAEQEEEEAEVVERVLAGMECAHAHGSVSRTAGLFVPEVLASQTPLPAGGEGRRRAEDACSSPSDSSHAAAREPRPRMDGDDDSVDYASATHGGVEDAPQADTEERTPGVALGVTTEEDGGAHGGADDEDDELPRAWRSATDYISPDIC